jgi:NAD(P)-dependent dehydrogenase (short-subunit alcohol dehydrogenase family)
MMPRVANKVAIVTGAAMGIGKACAELLAREGAAVAITDCESAAGKKVNDALLKEGLRSIFVEHDVSREDHWERVVNDVLKAFGKIDILVNNAGVGSFGDVEHTTIDEWHSLLRVNLDGVFLGIKHAIPPMRAAGGGSIINISSIEGLIGDPQLAAYNASKGAVRLLSKSAALYCARERTNIRVNSVHPGYILTPMVEHALASSPNSEAARQALEALHPVGHLGQPIDIAYGVLYLASDESCFATGSELVIDGGYTAQ